MKQIMLAEMPIIIAESGLTNPEAGVIVAIIGAFTETAATALAEQPDIFVTV